MGDSHKDMLDPLWYQHAPGKDYIAGGLLSGGDPLLTVKQYDAANRKETVLCRCAGTDGKFVVANEFANARFCSQCPARSGFAILPASCDNDLVSGKVSFWGPVKVPSGCPHALEESEEHPGRADARALRMRDGYSDVTAHSWKLFSDGNKLTLTVQYRQRFYDIRSGKQSERSSYRNICADLESGRSYVSDRSEPNHKHRKNRMRSPIEDMTYTGYSSYAAYCPSEEIHQMLPALEKMYLAMFPKMEELGLNPMAYRGRDGDTSNPTLVNMRQIAATNRFPNLGFIPLVNIRHMLPERYRKMINKLPRETDIPAMCRALGIPYTDAVAAMLDKDPSSMDLLFILARLGCTEESAFDYACQDGNTERLANSMRMCVAFRNEFGGMGLDIAPMFFPKMLPSSGWTGMLDVLMKTDEKKLEALFASCAQFVHRGQKLPWYDEQHPSERRFVPEGTPLSLPPSYEWSSRALGHKWKFTQKASYYQSPYSHQTVPHLVITLTKDGCEANILTLDGYMRLDRRKWPDKVNREYYETVIEYQRERLESPGGEAAKRLEEKLSEYEDRLLSSYVFDYRIATSKCCGERYSLEENEAKVILRWADKFSLDTGKLRGSEVFAKAEKAYQQGKRKRKAGKNREKSS